MKGLEYLFNNLVKEDKHDYQDDIEKDLVEPLLGRWIYEYSKEKNKEILTKKEYFSFKMRRNGNAVCYNQYDLRNKDCAFLVFKIENINNYYQLTVIPVENEVFKTGLLTFNQHLMLKKVIEDNYEQSLLAWVLKNYCERNKIPITINNL